MPDDQQGPMVRKRPNPLNVLACPFCGVFSYEYAHKRGVFSGQYYEAYSNTDGHKIRCEGCGVQTCWWHTKEQAINAWNARVERDTTGHRGGDRSNPTYFVHKVEGFVRPVCVLEGKESGGAMTRSAATRAAGRLTRASPEFRAGYMIFRHAEDGWLELFPDERGRYNGFLPMRGDTLEDVLASLSGKARATFEVFSKAVAGEQP